jgi:hypothetical protein
LRKTDGTGWIPVNFQSTSIKAPFPALPIDTQNNSTYYYTYVTGGSWNLTALLESNHEPILKTAINDGGAMPGVFELGTNTKLGPFTRDRGLVGFWRFEEGTGTSTADSSGTGNAGTLVNGPAWQTEANCKQGRCLSFDGVNDYVNAGNDASLSSSRSEMTVMAWFKLNGWTAYWEFIVYPGAGGTAFGTDPGKYFMTAINIGGTRYYFPPVGCLAPLWACGTI